MCLEISNNLLLVLQYAKNAFFLQIRDLLVSQKTTQRHFLSTLHPLSMVIFATATVLAFVLLCNSRFNFHCYTQCEATPTQKSARKCAATSCAKDYKTHSLQQTSFAESPNKQNTPLFLLNLHHYRCPYGRYVHCPAFLWQADNVLSYCPNSFQHNNVGTWQWL